MTEHHLEKTAPHHTMKEMIWTRTRRDRCQEVASRRRNQRTSKTPRKRNQTTMAAIPCRPARRQHEDHDNQTQRQRRGHRLCAEPRYASR